MIKPDGVQRGFVGTIISRFEAKGFQLNAMKFMQATSERLEEYYQDLKEKDFFNKLVEYVGSGPICCMVWEGEQAIATGRRMLGATDPDDSNVGTIRFDLSIRVERNVCDASDSTEAAKREIQLWFEQQEVVSWNNHSNN